MATKTYFLTNTTNGSWRTLAETPVTAANNPDGWVVGTGATLASEYAVNVTRAASTFLGTTVPDGTLDTSIKDAFRSTTPLNGAFAAANWTLSFVVRGVTQAGTAAGRIRFRILKANADGSSATEITSGIQTCAAVTITATSIDFTSSLTVSIPAASFTDTQDPFIQIAWERTAAGGMTTTDVVWRTGSSASLGTRIVTSDYTPTIQAVTTAAIASTVVMRAPTIPLPGAQAVTGATIGGAVSLDPTLIAYWPFEEGTGTTSADATGHGHTVTLGGAVWETLDPRFGAASLKASGSGTTYGTFTPIALGTEHTISGWIRTTGNEIHAMLVGGGSSPTAYGLFIDGGSLYYNPGSGAVGVTSGIQAYRDYFLTVVRSGIAVLFYVDGVLKGSPILSANTPLTVGAVGGQNDGTFPFDGVLDDVRLYSRMLSATEIETLFYTNPTHYWPFDEATGTTAADRAGNLPATVLVGGAWTTAQQKFGAAALVAGGSSRAASITRLDMGNRHSIACWINGWNGSDDGILIGENGAYAFYLDATDLYYNTGGSNFVSFAHGSLTGSHHLVLTRALGTVKVYVDGALLSTATLPSDATAFLYLDSFGAYNTNGFSIGVVLDDVRFYNNVELSATQVAALYAYDPTPVVGAASTLFAPTLTPVASTSQLVLLSTIAGGPDLLLEDGGGVLLEDGSGSVLLEDAVGVAKAFAPSVAVGALDQAVTTSAIASTATVRVPTVVPGPVVWVGATVPSGNQRFAPSVAPGPVVVVGATVPGGSQRFAPSVLPGAVTILLPSWASTRQVFAPLISTGQIILITGTVPATTVLSPLSVTTGPVTVGGSTIPATAQVFVPQLQPVYALIGASVGATHQVYPPLVIGAGLLATSFIASTQQVFAPGLDAVVEVRAGFVASTVTVRSPAVGYAVAIGICGPASQIWPPTIGVADWAVGGVTIPSTLQLIAPSVSSEQPVLLGTIDSTLQVYPPGNIYSLLGSRVISTGVYVQYVVTTSGVSCRVVVEIGTVHVAYRALGDCVVTYRADIEDGGVVVRVLSEAGVEVP